MACGQRAEIKLNAVSPYTNISINLFTKNTTELGTEIKMNIYIDFNITEIHVLISILISVLPKFRF